MAEDLTGVFKPEAKTIKKIFGDMDSYYRVPDYQRPYSWGSEQIEQLFDDFFEVPRLLVQPQPGRTLALNPAFDEDERVCPDRLEAEVAAEGAADQARHEK